jgi:hypothetical protein
MFCDRDEKMMVENARAARWSGAAHEDAQQRTETTPLMNEAQLNCLRFVPSVYANVGKQIN